MRQRRVLFFCHDGGGLGHLARLAKIAAALQGPCACLLVTGHRSAEWLVAGECEYVHLPSLDTLFAGRASYWGRAPFLSIDKTGALEFRRQILDAVVRSFAPDAIFVDYLPAGKFDEMAEIIEQTRARKYLVLRGVLDEPAIARQEIFSGRAGRLVEAFYDRVLVTCDGRVIDVAAEYALSDAAAAKLRYVGYVAPSHDDEALARARAGRRIPAEMPWVVAGAGSGKHGEDLIDECARLAGAGAHLAWDIVAGPKAHRPGAVDAHDGRVREWSQSPSLSTWHAACDLVVTRGGYNCVTEAIAGGTPLVVWPGTDPEQRIHAQRLRAFHPLAIVGNSAELAAAVGEVRRKQQRRAPELDLDGLTKIRSLVLDDLA